MKTFLEWLQDVFIKNGEMGGISITKDNCESMFEGWLENKDVNDIIEFADLYGRYCKIKAKEEILVK